MGLFSRQESEDQVVKRLAKHAGNMVEMFKATFTTPKGIDATQALIFTSSLAGHACRQAVIAEHGKFMEVTCDDGRKFYFGDDLNYYLLESRTSVVGFISVVTGIDPDTVRSIVERFASGIGEENFTVCGYDPKKLYEDVSQCWDGIFENMTSKYCKNPSEWPILFSIVVQNILVMSLKAGAPVNDVAKIAVECAVAVSKMSEESFITNS